MSMDRRQFMSTAALAPIAWCDGFAAAVAQPTVPWPSTFPALRQQVNGHPLTYLDSAATTLRPQSVIDALAEYYTADNANPSRVHTLASRAADRLSAARQTLARFINAAEPAEVIFVRGTTEGINLVAATFGAATVRAGDEIIVSIAEHNSNILPWTRVARSAGAHVRVLDVRGSISCSACSRGEPES
jgi:selenocysteine lyase/cysteine desulfurase